WTMRSEAVRTALPRTMLEYFFCICMFSFVSRNLSASENSWQRPNCLSPASMQAAATSGKVVFWVSLFSPMLLLRLEQQAREYVVVRGVVGMEGLLVELVFLRQGVG